MKYTYQHFDKDRMARAMGVSLGISKKHGMEICNYVKNKSVADAKKMLQAVIDLKDPVPFRRFNRDLGHKTGKGAARFPVKASEEVKKMIESAESNAQFKGLNTAGLRIKHIAIQQASTAWHYGRQRRRRMKRAHLEVVVEETKKAEKKAPAPKAKPEAKTAEKSALAKAEQKPQAEKKPEVKADTKPAAKPKAAPVKAPAPKAEESKKAEQPKEAPKQEAKEQPQEAKKE